MKTNSTLEARALSIGYKHGKQRFPVASNICFSLGRGELAAIVGVNGIGKSTLLRTLGRIQPALKGQTLLNGKPMESFKDRELASELSVVLTDPIASRSLSVAELVSLGRHPYTNWIGSIGDEDKKSISRAIETVGLQELQHKKCYELSDGQMQQVLIARALAQDTALMLLDEPTTHLDIYHKVQVLELLRRIAHENGKTIFFTTHEIDMAIQLCDRILLLDNKENPFGDPCTLIEEKRFENLFPPDLIKFDAETGTFRVHKSAPGAQN
jgi:iron complex transport system ATP-binding protein